MTSDIGSTQKFKFDPTFDFLKDILKHMASKQDKLYLLFSLYKMIHEKRLNMFNFKNREHICNLMINYA